MYSYSDEVLFMHSRPVVTRKLLDMIRKENEKNVGKNGIIEV
jgi:hypothetical protein